jgi:cytochrome c peroxidase
MTWVGGSTENESNTVASTGLGTIEALNAGYDTWEKAYEAAGGDRSLMVPVGPFKGLSREQVEAKGLAKLNLIDGSVSVEVRGLPRSAGWDVWLVDNGAGSSVIPDEGDTTRLVGSLTLAGASATINAELGSQAFADFDPDLVVVTHKGARPSEEIVLAGTTTLFHRLYRSKATAGRLGVSADAQPVPTPSKDEGFLSGIAKWMGLTAEAQIGPIPNPSTPQQHLITQGRNLFLNERFSGNGRTCATCHREDNNMTIDPDFISTLSINDPLFVAETNPNLARDFENPVLMRKFGLILENVDGFDDLPNKFVMRGVPHLLGLPLSLTPVPGGFDLTTTPPNDRTGWGGDGAPGTGTLREFAIGAVIQHFTKRLDRVPGTDFVLPTAAQLDAIEAFIRSLGRQEEVDTFGMVLKDPVADRGRRLFNSPGSVFGLPNEGAGKCVFCHFNAGANDLGGFNSNFDIGTFLQPDKPATLAGQPNPPDAGFGRTPHPSGGFGTGFFNTPAALEAADTGPYFHDNSVATLEGTIAFYLSPSFRRSDAGIGLGPIELNGTQVTSIAAFLRVLNALENVRSATEIANRAKQSNNSSQARELIVLAINEVEDAIKVLSVPGIHQDARGKLTRALGHLALALVSSSVKSLRDRKIDDALPLLQAARADMIV